MLLAMFRGWASEEVVGSGAGEEVAGVHLQGFQEEQKEAGVCV